VLLHELGHILGFRHEHIHVPACSEGDTNWRKVTPYDSASVMHYPPYAYPQCNGTNTGDYALTSLDRWGVGSLYGSQNRKNFNGDVNTDVLWYQPLTGQVSAWLLNGMVVSGTAELNWKSAASEGWKIKGTGDFNRDGQTDVLWYQPSSGRVALWLLNGTTVIGNPDISWKRLGSDGWDIKGTGDFNRDGNVDILWYQPSSGRVGVWLLGGTTTVIGNPDISWKVLGSEGWVLLGRGVLVGVGLLVVVWFVGCWGGVGVWVVFGTTVVGNPDINGIVPGSDGWDIKGTGDFYRDGNVDILWYQPSTGRVNTWWMNGTTIINNMDLSWKVLGGSGWEIVSR
jgi:hypothetical protein